MRPAVIRARDHVNADGMPLDLQALVAKAEWRLVVTAAPLELRAGLSLEPNDAARELERRAGISPADFLGVEA